MVSDVEMAQDEASSAVVHCIAGLVVDVCIV